MSLDKIVNAIYKLVPYSLDVGIVCGSGLSNIVALVQNPIVIPYNTLPDFPHSEVDGHKNELVVGQLGEKNVICFRGRFHFYEGWSAKESVLGIKIMAALGVKMAIITNAAGGIHPDFTVGDVMVIEDHISFLGFAGQNPLIGKNNDEEGPRFPSVSSVYDPGLIEQFTRVHDEIKEKVNHNHDLQKGCYAGVAGPNYESRHEIQMLRTCGASAVGMSTVNEVVQAAHSGIKVLGLSLITNSCLGTAPEDYTKPEPHHGEIIIETRKVESFVQTVIADFVAQVDLSSYPVPAISQKFTREAVANAGSGSSCVNAVLGCPFSRSEQTSYCPFSCPAIRTSIIGVLSGFLGAYAFFAAKDYMDSQKQ